MARTYIKSTVRPAKPIGRPTKLTPELQDTICDCIRKGLYLQSACAAVGIDQSTFYHWNDRAQGGEELYVDFFRDVKKAEAEDKLSRLEDARSKAKERKSWEENWRYLEARYPAEYARHEVVHNTGKDEALRVIQILLEEIKKPELDTKESPLLIE